MLGHLLLALYLYQDCVAAQSQYAAIPRWGQAVALVESTLYVHGGRTDPYNSFSYTSAPVNNDLLALPLTSSFNPSSPPFIYVGGCSNCSSNQGPAVAWHTLTPLNTSNLLLFGGDPGPNSQVVLPDRADSSVLLSVSDHDSPIWNFETDSWASEPMRRIHHTAVSVGGRVWIVGGEKADGSGTAFAQHYVFDPSGPSFTQLPTTDGPGDITGHQAVPLADGRILVFGGYSPSEKSLIPLSTVWVLDTTKPSWSRLSVSTPSVPPPRRAFAAAVLDSNRVLIHGGADAVLQTTLDDGWVLDTSQSPATWTNVSALTQLGPRRDHFAIGLGTMAIFGFGYAQNGAASASLVVFDAASGTFQTTYTPPSVITAPTATTLPGPTQTGQGSTGTGQPGSAEYPRPTGSQTPGGGDPGGSDNGSGNGGGGGNGNGDGEPSVSGNSSKSHATAIALGTVFGVLGLLVATTAASWYLRRRNSRDSFHRLHPSHDEDSPYSDGPIPVAGMAGSHEKGLPLPPVVRTVKDRLSRVVPGITPSRTQQQRRDMLADEDAREFETAGWYHVERHPSSAQSSWTSKGRPTLEKVYDSLASLKSMGGAMLDYAAGAAAAAAGGRGIKSREGSSSSRADVIWNNEKQRSFDPYEDDFGLLHYSSPPLQADRPRGGRQASSYTYVDPFDDYDIESLKFDPNQEYHDDEDEAKGFLSLRDPPPRTKLQSMMPPATLDLTRLTPVSERTSVPTLSDPASSSETSLSHPSVPFVASSSSSHDPPQSPRRPSSILDTNAPPSQPIQRSNSWWVRFTKTPLLDRRSSNASRTSRPLDFRDPNPLPRLIPIEESVHSNSPDSPEGKRRSGSGGHTQRFSTHHHGRSASSLGTAKTADSDILERMARTMTIVQKEGSTTSSQRSAPSRDVSGDTNTNTHDDFGAVPPPVRPHSARPLSMIESSRSNVVQGGPALVMSPTEMTQEEAGQSISALVSPPPARPSLPERVSSGSKVAERIQAYERRMSMEQGPPPPSKSPTKSKSPPPVPPRTRTSAYGLAPKAPLFVANPDHRHQSSGDS